MCEVNPQSSLCNASNNMPYILTCFVSLTACVGWCVCRCLRCESVYTCAPMHVICFMWFPFVYRLTLILKITWFGLFSVINQTGSDWLVLNMIKWSSELSLHVPGKLFESIQALKASFCWGKQSHADPNWLRNETRQKDSNNSVFFIYAAGFGGSFCEVNLNECQSNPCQNGGICVDSIDLYQCFCSEGKLQCN